jgi:peptide methionine sulfoxide reductase msrA/msrB
VAEDTVTREIYLAGGCFWGVEKYFAAVTGVVETEAGYANGPTPAPTYEEVCADSGHVETVRVAYDPDRVALEHLLELFFAAIDPTAVNRQGPDQGIQYRSGIYYTDPADALPVRLALASLGRRTAGPVAIESGPLDSFSPAESYHQRYLDSHPDAHCHIPPAAFQLAAAAPPPAPRRGDPDLAARLTPLQFAVTQRGATEEPFTGEYDRHFAAGLYVDRVSGEPLFSSAAKFDSGCGWPAFARPITPAAVTARPDLRGGRQRTEIRSAGADSHLGHVFDDGPAELGGARYCINSAALRFIPRDQLAAEGYAEWLAVVDETDPDPGGQP